ncbi:MAG: tetratricopeptide repeat protein, partial [Sphingobacteriales bacterium]
SDLYKLRKDSRNKKETIQLNNRISNFYTNNKLYTKKNIDSAFFFANQALLASSDDLSGSDYGLSQITLAKIWLKMSMPQYVLKNIRPAREDVKIKLLIETAKFYLYKPKEEKNDLDSAMFLLNKACGAAELNSMPKLANLAEIYICDVYRERRQDVRSRLAFAAVIEKCRKSGDVYNQAGACSRWGDHLPLGPEKLTYYRNALNLYKSIGFSQEYIEMEKAIADVQLNMGLLQQAEKGLLIVLDRYNSLGFQNLQYTYDLLSVVYRLQGKLKDALSNSLLAIKYMQITGSDASKGFFLGNLASTYAELGETDKSVKYYQQSLDAMQEQNPEVKLNGLKLLSDELIKEGHIREILSLSRIYETDNRNPMAKVILATIRGNAYNKLKQYSTAEKYYLDMIKWEGQMQSNLFHSAESFYTIAGFYAQRKNYEKSVYYYNKVLALPSGVSPLSRITSIYHNLYQADSAQKNFPSALENYKKYKASNDFLLNARSNRDIQELLIQYNANQKEKDNELLRKESILQKNKLQRAEWLTKVSIIGLFGLTVIIVLYYYGYKNRKKANEQLESHQFEITLKNNSLERLIEKQSKLLLEKEWLIKEIHHRIKNNLQVVTSLLSAQSNYLENKEALSAIRDSQNRIQSISLIHQKLFQSESVSSVNIEGYIVELLKFLSDTFHVGKRIKFEFKLAKIEMGVAQAMPLGLIINEAVTNIIKYAFPDGRNGKVIISLNFCEDGLYCLSIKDNGIGLPENIPTTNNSTLGVSLMKGLSSQLDGFIEITSENGVCVSLKFPSVAIEEQPAGN